MKRVKGPSTPQIRDEFDGIDTGDERLDARVQMMASTLARDPGLSLPEAFSDEAQLEAAYRAFNNEKITVAELLRPHTDATADRLLRHGTVLCVHDTTEFIFGGKTKRAGFGRKNGFLAHLSLAVSADGRREPLGVLALRTWTRRKEPFKKTNSRQRDPDRMSTRWFEQSVEAESVVDAELIHVEDREADIYESEAKRIALGMRFITRAKSNRVVRGDKDGIENIRERLRRAPHPIERTVMLSRRDVDNRQHTHQSRDGRSAKLSIGACRVDLRRSAKDKGDLPVFISLNAVHVIEVDAPEGEQIVEWLLLTSEPILTEADICFIVDSYRARWVIEEYFKALKTGCTYEARQLESFEALERALAIYAVIAWRLLWMRFRCRHPPALPAHDIASPHELGVLVAQGRLARDATAVEFMLAIAELGGHIAHNKNPGWLVLWRGFRTLEILAAGFAAATERCDQ